MPIVTWEGGRLTKEQKSELIRKLTDVAADVTGVPSKFYTVVIREQPDENLGVAGETVEQLKSKLVQK